MLVDIDKIPDILPDQSHGSPVIDPSGYAVWDAIWGYYQFGQSVSVQYESNDRYRTVGRFTIEGMFTTNARENEPDWNYKNPSQDESAYLANVAMSDALVALFVATKDKDRPTNFSLWGTASDQGCVKLPDMLKDKNGNPVYARPISISLSEIDNAGWPIGIAYQAELEEAISPSAKVMVEDEIIDNGIINIVVKSPRMNDLQYAFANGQESFFDGWNLREIAVNGTTAKDLGNSANMKEFINKISDGKATIKVKNSSGDETTITSNSFMTGSNLSIDKKRGLYSVNLRVKE